MNMCQKSMKTESGLVSKRIKKYTRYKLVKCYIIILILSNEFTCILDTYDFDFSIGEAAIYLNGDNKMAF